MQTVRTAQFAMEYLLVVGFSLLIIIPLGLLLHDEYSLNKQEVSAEHLTELARELAYQAEKLHYQGAPSTTTIKASLPAGVEEAHIDTDNNEIVFTLRDNTISIRAYSKAPLEGALLAHEGLHTFTLRADDNNTLEPEDDRVVITDT